MEIGTVKRRGTNCSKWDGLEDKFGRSDILPLWVADMDISAPKAVQNAMLQRLQHPVYGYTLYSDSFYQSIVDWYHREFGWSIKKEWIVPEHGVVVSINIAIEAFTCAGDGILVQTPIYPPFVSSVENHSRVLLNNKLRFKDGKTTIDFDDFEEKAKDAKLFLLCSPHNPSGRAWSTKELERMVEICHRHGVLIVSDEIHSDLLFDTRHTPAAIVKNAHDTTLVLHAPSKTFNIAGLNTSYLIVPNSKLREQYIVAHRRSGLDNGNVFGVTALEAAYREGKPWLEKLKEHIVINREFVHQFISSGIPEIEVYKNEATFLIWLDCRKLDLDDEALASFFVNDAKLGLNSGISFGEAGSGFMRLNLGTSLENIQEAMGRLKAAVERLKNR